MRRFGTAIIFSLALVCFACGGGGSNNIDPIQGNWEAGLANPDGTTTLGFTATLTQSGSAVSITKFSFVAPSSCFAEGTTTTGLFTSTGTAHGVTSGTFQMTIQSGPSNPNGANTLALQGTFVRDAISGTWTLAGTGTDCNKPGNFTSGNFTMLPMTQM